MNNEGKKVAFSFSKVKKNALVNKINVEPKEKIEYVDCFDGSKGKFSFKGSIRNDKEEKHELVIPMPISHTSTDIVKSRIEEKANRNLESLGINKAEEIKSQDNKESQNQLQSIDDIAALEILNEIKNGTVENKSNNTLVIASKKVIEEASENDIDYDNIPVTDFGLAMLRGMGWRPDLGIGKEPRLVEAASPKLRPKGLGLGAKPNETNNVKKEEEKEKLKLSSADRKHSNSADKKHSHSADRKHSHSADRKYTHTADRKYTHPSEKRH